MRIYLDSLDNHDRRLDECPSREGDDIFEGQKSTPSPCEPVSQMVFIDKGGGRVSCNP